MNDDDKKVIIPLTSALIFAGIIIGIGASIPIAIMAVILKLFLL